jgi:tetratricopeptide (TPR) repeat protein
MKDDSTRANVTDQTAMAYAREKMDSDADATFRKAIDSYGNLPAAHIAYGDYLESKTPKDHTGALREWTTAVGANRDNPPALGRLGQAAAQSNDFPKAVEYFKRLTEVVSTDPAPWVLLGQGYMATKNWNAAHDAFRASFNLSPSADALVGLAAADQQMRNYTEAIQIYEVLDKNAALTKAPGLLFNMAVAYQSANQPQKAKAAYVRLLTTQKPGTQGYTEVQQLIAKIDHPGSSSSAKPAPKASAKPGAKPVAKAAAKPGAKPTPTATPKS